MYIIYMYRNYYIIYAVVILRCGFIKYTRKTNILKITLVSVIRLLQIASYQSAAWYLQSYMIYFSNYVASV